MPKIQSNGAALNVETEGREDAPVLMLSNSLGTNLHMWDAQMPAFTQHFRVVRYDRRGHGQSDAPKGPYTMEMLGRDVLAIMDALKIKKASWCGLSMGGMVGMWLGANAPERFERMVFSNTGAYYPDKAPWNDRIKTAREKGMEALAGATMERWFTKRFRDEHPDKIETMKAAFLKTPLEGYVGCCEAVRDMDHREVIKNVKVPVLVIAGRDDNATPVALGEYIHQNTPGSKLKIVEGAHIANLEDPKGYTDAVLSHLRP
jgi:3-oxoadipate enol-lactonase